ncbi:unnamed protein product [Durusdinium trenchii]|uniref:Uncharacterized protein n=1 Tax=Durusdinium trenchii TaxID=1381693 RepID=A0ABP0MMW9_9DINO
MKVQRAMMSAQANFFPRKHKTKIWLRKPLPGRSWARTCEDASKDGQPGLFSPRSKSPKRQQCCCKQQLKLNHCANLPFIEGYYKKDSTDGKEYIYETESGEALELPPYVHKTEPSFELFDGILGENGMVTFGKLASEPTILLKNQYLTDGKVGEVLFYAKLRVSFQTTMQLQEYPFDEQYLKFYIISRAPKQYVTLVLEKDQYGVIESKCRKGLDKDLDRFCITKGKEPMFVEAKVGTGIKEYAQVKGNLPLRHKAKQCLMEVVLVRFIFVLACFSIFFIKLTDEGKGERIGAILTTIFALQGIQYRLGDNELPVKSYSTWLDNYIAISYFFLLSLLLELALVLLYVDHFSIHPAEKAPRANAAFEGVERREEDVSIDRISIGNKIDAGFAYAWLLGWILWHIHVWCKYCRWRHQPHEHADDEPVEKTERRRKADDKGDYVELSCCADDDRDGPERH